MHMSVTKNPKTLSEFEKMWAEEKGNSKTFHWSKRNIVCFSCSLLLARLTFNVIHTENNTGVFLNWVFRYISLYKFSLQIAKHFQNEYFAEICFDWQYLSIFSLNARKCGKNADNFEYGHFLCSEHLPICNDICYYFEWKRSSWGRHKLHFQICNEFYILFWMKLIKLWWR